MKPAENVVHHQVGKCPACRCGIWAEVTLDVTLGNPRLNGEGMAQVWAKADAVAVELSHSCDRREREGEWRPTVTVEA